MFKKIARITLWSIAGALALANISLASWHNGHEVGYINAMGDVFFGLASPEKVLTQEAIKRGYIKERQR